MVSASSAVGGRPASSLTHKRTSHRVAGGPAALRGAGAVAPGLHHGDGAHGAAEGNGVPPQPAPEPAGGRHQLLAITLERLAGRSSSSAGSLFQCSDVI